MKENEVLAPQYYRHTLLSENDLKYVNEECKRAYTTYSCKLNRRASMDTALRAFLIADKGFSIERAMVLDDISNEDYMNYFKEYISKYHNPEKSVEDNLKALGGMHERLYEKLQDFQIPDFGGELKTRDQLMEQERVLHGLKNFMIDMGQDYEKLDSGKTEPDKRRMYMSGMKDTAKFEQNRAKAVIYNQYVLSNMTYINSPNYGKDGECLALDFLKDFHKQYGGKKVSEISNTEVINVNVVNGTIPSLTPKLTSKDDKSGGSPEYDKYLKGEVDTYPKKKMFEDLKVGMRPSYLGSAKDDVLTETKRARDVNLSEYSDVLNEDILSTDDMLSLPDNVKEKIQESYYKSYKYVYTGPTLMTYLHVVKDEFDLFKTADGKTIREVVDEKYPNASDADKNVAMQLETMRHAITSGIGCDYFEIDNDLNFTRKSGEVAMHPDDRLLPMEFVNEQLGLINDTIMPSMEEYYAANSISSREGKNRHPEDITAEMSIGATRSLTAEGQKLGECMKILKRGFTSKEIDDLVAEFNRVAENHNKTAPEGEKWKERRNTTSPDGFTRMATSLEEQMAFYNIVMQTYKNKPYKLIGTDNNIGNEISEVKYTYDKDFEELTTKPYDKKIENLKKTAVTDDDKEMLDQVNNQLSERADSYTFFSSYFFTDTAGVILETRAIESMDKLQGGHYGKYGDMQKTESLPGSEIQITVSTNPKLVQDLENNPVTMSEGSKAKVLETLKKIKEAGYVDKDAPIEQGTKIYVHAKLIKARKELQKAVDSGSLDKIRVAKEAYENEHRKMEGLFQSVRENFGDIDVAPGNVYTVRNADVPPEFSLDTLNDSKLNGLYQAANACEKMGITPEEFLENPGKHLLEYVRKSTKNHSLEKYNKGDSFLSSYEKLYERSYSTHDNKNRINNDIGLGDTNLYVNRVLDGIILMESDPEKRMELERYKMLIIDEATDTVNREDTYQSALADIVEGEEKGQDYNDLKDGLKEAFLEGGNIERRHLPVVQTDDLGGVIPKTSNYQELLSQKDKYKDIIKKYETSLKDLERINEANERKSDSNKEKDDAGDYKHLETIVNADVALESIEESIFDYLMAHPEDSMKPEYKELEKKALEAHENLGLSGRSKVAAQYNKWKKDYNSELNVLGDDAKNIDTRFNKNIERLQKRINKAVKTGNQKSLNESVEIFKDMVEDRLKDLADDYRLHRVTESYYIERTEQLLSIRENPTRKMGNIPKFLDPKDPERYARDTKMIGDRVKNNTKDHYLDNIKNFKRWKLQQKDMELLEESELSADEWNALYKSEIERATAGISLPAGYRELDNSLNSDLNLGYGSIVNEADLDASGKLESSVYDKPVTNKKYTLKSKIKEFKAEFVEPDRDRLDKHIELLAECITAEISERMGSLPNGVEQDVFARRLLKNPDFQNFANMTINNIYSEYAKNGMQAGMKTADTIITLVQDQSILKGCDLNQKYREKNKEKLSDPNFKEQEVLPGDRYMKQRFIEKRYPRPTRHKGNEHDKSRKV